MPEPAPPGAKLKGMAQQVNAPRGTRDFLPAEKAQRERVLSTIRDSYRSHGFDEIETPVFDDIERLHSGLGGDNEKLSFSILKRGLSQADLQQAADADNALMLADLGLRFDLTVPLARFYASHRAALPGVFRAIQIAPVWRAERPQKGRYRQFTQCDIDIIGEAGIIAEVELLSATLSTLKALGVEQAQIRINDRRILSALLEHFGFPEEQHPSALITIDKLDKVGVEGVIAELEENGAAAEAVAAFRAFMMRPQTMEFNPYGERQIRKALPQGFEHEAIADLVAIGEGLAGFADGSISGLPIVFDPFLVRGMGYYTGTIFEIHHPEFGYSLGGGGRYDGMIGRFSGQQVPAAGFSIGFDRMVELFAQHETPAGSDTVLVHSAELPLSSLMALKQRLIAEGKRVRLLKKPKKLAPALESLKAAGFSSFAVLDTEQDAAAPEFRELS